TTFLLCGSKEGIETEGHKLLSSSDAVNNKFTSALMIPNHTISWAVYEHLGGEIDIEVRFYKFNNSQINSSFYAQNVVPKIDHCKLYSFINAA
ncbi:MAG: hypothetical protein M3Y25_09965, partial [Thermoproteota archaeon]|nr:hypothetical protein [Thermoproteota archaeon]